MIKRKGQINAPIVLLLAFLMYVGVFALMPALKAGMEVSLNSNLTSAGTKFLIFLLPGAFVLFVTLWMLFYLRSG